MPDVKYPDGKEEVLSNAQSNGVPQEVVDRIGYYVVPADTFKSAYEVLQAVQGLTVGTPTARAWYFAAGV